MNKKLTRDELIQIVRKIQNAEYDTEKEHDILMSLLESNILDPEISGYIYWPEKEMTAEEIIDKALKYKPIIL